MVECLAAEAFALVVFYCDSYLTFKGEPEICFDGESSKRMSAARFFNMAGRLPMDLQMVLCNRLFGSAKTLVLTKNSEPAFLCLASAFYSEETLA